MNIHKRPVFPFILLVGVAIFPALGASPDTHAATAGRRFLSGKVASLKGNELTVQTDTGPEAVRLADRTVIRGEVPIKFSEVTPGMYVGATAAQQADGTYRATRLHVFSEDQRGIGEGHRPLRSTPGSGLTMTNANVETVTNVQVGDVTGRMLTLKYKGGELKVLVPPEAVVVKRVRGDRSLLKKGALVSIQASQAPGQSPAAIQITVRAPAR